MRNYDKIFDNKNVTWISADIAHEKKYIEKVKSLASYCFLYTGRHTNLNSQNSRKSLFNSINFLNNIRLNSIENNCIRILLGILQKKGICKLRIMIVTNLF